MTELEIHDELSNMAYRHGDFQKLITFVWALPDQFWSRVAKRLIATAIVGIQPEIAKPLSATAGYVRIPSE